MNKLPIEMLASQPKQLVVDDTLKWDEYVEGQEYYSILCCDQIVQVSTDSTLIVICEVFDTIGDFCILSVWDSSTLQKIGSNCYDSVEIIGVQISPDNKWIIIYTNDKAILFETYNLKAFRILELTSKEYHDPIAMFTSDSQYIITCGNSIIIIHSIYDKLQKPIVIDFKSESVNSLKCSRNILIYATSQRKIQVWSTNTNMNVHYWHAKGCVDNISLSSNGKILITIGYKSTIKMWSTQTKKLIRKFGKLTKDFKRKVDLSPNGLLIESNKEQEICLLWNMNTGNCITFEKNIFDASYTFTQDGKFIIRRGLFPPIKIWDVNY